MTTDEHTMREWLIEHANLLNKFLAEHGVHGRVQGGRVTTRTVEFKVIPMRDTSHTDIKALAGEVSILLGADCLIRSRGAAVSIEIPRPWKCQVEFSHLFQLCNSENPCPSNAAILGLQENGEPLLLNIDTPDTGHIAIIGDEHSGKSTMLRTLVLSLALVNKPVTPRTSDGLGTVIIPIDPMDSGTFTGLEKLPHCHRGVVTDITEAGSILDGYSRLAKLDEDDRRYQVIIAVDDVDVLLNALGTRMEDALMDLLEFGYPVGIHLLAATWMHPFSGGFPVKILGKVQTADDAVLAARRPGTKAHELEGDGDMVVVTEDDVTRFQAAIARMEDVNAAINLLAELETPLYPYHPLQVIQ